MNILMVYPEYPDTYWSFRHALKFISKKAAIPPLGLITISAMLPPDWGKKLVDLNVTTLKDQDLLWADYVFISAMYVQKKSVAEIINRCQAHEVTTVAGGPLFTQEWQNYPTIDHFVLNEAEITMPFFLKDLKTKGKPERIYQTGDYADITTSPVPDYQLLSSRDYASMSLQVTRGCPFACDFCEITSLLGRKVRMKKTEQVINELQALYDLNWRGMVSIVDDNFIGNKKELKHDLLPAMLAWMHKHNYPFNFSAQTSINLADDPDLMTMMTATGFTSTFIGIETPEEDSLTGCHKIQNKNRNLIDSVRKIQQNGMQVSGGFIVGFDTDAPSIFQRQVEFIQQSGIVSAMVGLLNAPKNTKLYQRLMQENRLTIEASGDNTDCSMNFIPKMNYDELLHGYKTIIQNIYQVRPYYQRIRQFLSNYQKKKLGGRQPLKPNIIKGFFKSIVVIGVMDRGRTEFWKFLIWTLFHRPGLIVDAMTFAVYGFHYRTVYGLRK